jgi:hypothetical protein
MARSISLAITAIMIPCQASVVAITPILFAGPPVGLVMTDRASDACAEETMVPHDMAG